jgi:hypothetical protein
MLDLVEVGFFKETLIVGTGFEHILLASEELLVWVQGIIFLVTYYKR